MTTLSLSKGQTISLAKSNGTSLRRAKIDIQWSAVNYDIDVSAALLNTDNKFAFGLQAVTTQESPMSNNNQAYKSLIYYHNLHGKDVGGLSHTGDVLSGGNHDGESILLELDKIPMDVSKVALCVTSHNESNNISTFGNSQPVATVKDADTNEELFKFELGYDSSNFTSAIIGVVARRGNDWIFEATGLGVGRDPFGLKDIISKYS